MSNIELVLTDIDGTLVSAAQHDPSPAVSQTIVDLENAGVTLTAATGRPYEMAHGLFTELGLKGLCIFDAGASIRDVETGDFAWKNWLEIERLKAISSIILPHCSVIDFFPVFKEVTPQETGPYQIVTAAPYVFAFVRNDTVETISQQLLRIPGLSVRIGPGRPKDIPGQVDIQITDINADKFHAVSALRNIVHSTRERTLAIGDSTNDLPLFQNAGVKVAMGNAMQALKNEADHVVGSVEEDGFSEAMRRFVLF